MNNIYVIKKKKRNNHTNNKKNNNVNPIKLVGIMMEKEKCTI